MFSSLLQPATTTVPMVCVCNMIHQGYYHNCWGKMFYEIIIHWHKNVIGWRIHCSVPDKMTRHSMFYKCCIKRVCKTLPPGFSYRLNDTWQSYLCAVRLVRKFVAILYMWQTILCTNFFIGMDRYWKLKEDVKVLHLHFFELQSLICISSLFWEAHK